MRSEMDAQTWWDQCCIISDAMYDSFTSKNMYDFCGYGDILCQKWSAYASASGGILLSGQAGTGRHNTAFYVAKQLEDKYGFGSIYAASDLLCEGADCFEQVQERIEYVQNEFREEEMPLCLILDEWESCPFLEKLLRYLERTLCEYRAHTTPDAEEPWPGFCLILISDGSQRLPPVLHRLMHSCQMKLPNERKRKEYFEHFGITLLDYISVDTLAANTKGASYDFLAEICENSRLLTVQYEMNEDYDSLRTVLGELVEVTTDEEKNENADFHQQLLSLLEKLTDAFVQGAALPVPIPNPAPSPVPEPTPLPAAKPAKLTEDDLNKMPVRDLAKLALGEENALLLSSRA